MALSTPLHLGTKAVWAGEISLPSKGLIRVTRIFEMILYTKLHKLMGLKLLKDFGFWHFGINVIMVSLRYFGTTP